MFPAAGQAVVNCGPAAQSQRACGVSSVPALQGASCTLILRISSSAFPSGVQLVWAFQEVGAAQQRSQRPDLRVQVVSRNSARCQCAFPKSRCTE